MSHPIETSPTPAPAHGWTPERKAMFLDRLACHGNARSACRNVGLSAEAAYKLRRRDPLFARGWAAALVLARENCAQVLGERAIEGVEEEIYYRGELIGTRRRYDTRLLLAHLARLDRLADEQAAEADTDAGAFDTLLAAVASISGEDDVFERAEHVRVAVQTAQEDYHRLGFDDPLDHDDAQPGLTDIEADRALFCERARWNAVTDWLAQRQEHFAAIDALSAATEPPAEVATVAATSPINPPAAVLVRCPETPPAIFPWTLSTASTAALAIAQTGPALAPSDYPARSPFAAPRKLTLGPGNGRRNFHAKTRR